MINYLNIYNQLQTLDNLKPIIINRYEFTIAVCMLVILFAIAICIIGIYAIIKGLKYGNKIDRSDICMSAIIIAAIVAAIICAIAIKLALNNINMIERNTIDVIKLCKNDTCISSKYKIDDLLTYKELNDILTVNGVTNIDSFKSNVSYLKENYRKKVNTFKTTYDKDVTVSEHEYVNSILNQFYLGKINNTPADITGFEEDYPKVSINLKK